MPIGEIRRHELPPAIRDGISAVLTDVNIHFAAAAPNTDGAALVTGNAIMDIPPGYTIVLTYKPAMPLDLPPDHQRGKLYLIP